MNKSDLADKNQNEKWIRYFKNKGDLAILVDSNSGKGIKESEKKRLAEEREEQRKTMLNKEQSQTEKNTIENTIENAKNGVKFIIK